MTPGFWKASAVFQALSCGSGSSWRHEALLFDLPRVGYFSQAISRRLLPAKGQAVGPSRRGHIPERGLEA